MKLIQRTNQAGYSAMFIIVGVVLFLGLISSVYFVKIHGDQVRKDQAIATYEKQKTDQAKSEVDKKAKESKAAEPDASKASEVASTEISTGGVPASTSLPATGPEMIVAQLIGVGLITVAISAYFLSRRNLVRYL